MEKKREMNDSKLESKRAGDVMMASREVCEVDDRENGAKSFWCGKRSCNLAVSAKIK